MYSRSEVRVFVDDYATGRMPAVCAVTGSSTSDQIRIRTNVSPLSGFWLLLLFLGPLGWLVLLAVSVSSRSYLEGWLPYSHEEALRRRRERRRGLAAGGAVIACLLLLAAGLHSGLFVGLAVLATLGASVVLAISARPQPEIRLDASGRWVTLRRVHPGFAAAVEQRDVAEV